jgi:ethanolamine utilization cobalamin adenosyltransferase
MYQKPEYMTVLKEMAMVNKDHPMIRFRGKLDSLQSKILEIQIAFQKLGLDVNGLEEVLSCTREIMRCEVVGRDFEEKPLLGMDSGEIHARSHNPFKYYGIPHFTPGLEHGEAVILLNSLRAQVREVERVAYDAFKGENDGPERLDILRVLNRLSSLFYVMMFEMVSKDNPSSER